MSLIFWFSMIATPSPAARPMGGVVREPDEAAARHEIRVRERQVGRPEHRDEGQAEHDEHGRARERPAGDVARTADAAIGIPGDGGLIEDRGHQPSTGSHASAGVTRTGPGRCLGPRALLVTSLAFVLARMSGY